MDNIVKKFTGASQLFKKGNAKQAKKVLGEAFNDWNQLRTYYILAGTKEAAKVTDQGRIQAILYNLSRMLNEDTTLDAEQMKLIADRISIIIELFNNSSRELHALSKALKKML